MSARIWRDRRRSKSFEIAFHKARKIFRTHPIATVHFEYNNRGKLTVSVLPVSVSELEDYKPVQKEVLAAIISSLEA